VPNSSAVPILESVYSHIVEMYYNAMIGSKLSKYLDDIAIKIDEDNNIYFNTSLLKAHLLVLREFEMYDADEVAELCSYLHYFGGAVQNDFELYSRVRNLAISIYPADKELFDDYISDSFIGGVENDTIWGSDSANTLFGKSGDDVIYAYGGNDALEGGKGDDTLYGGYGDDTYIFNIGDGADVINEQEAGSAADRILFGEGISP
jgi:Ca2+-binding RTX toxin-like protein